VKGEAVAAGEVQVAEAHFHDRALHAGVVVDALDPDQLGQAGGFERTLRLVAVRTVIQPRMVGVVDSGSGAHHAERIRIHAYFRT